MMDCNRFRGVLADVNRPGALPGELRESALAHAESCSECGQLLSETELLDAELRGLMAREGDSQGPTGLETQLLKAFRQHNLTAKRKNTRRYATAIGIAAVLLLAFGFWLNRRTTDNKRLPGLRVTQPVVATGVGAHEGGGAAPAPVQSVAREMAANHPSATPSKRDALKSEGPAANSDGSAEFIPLPDADPGPLDDGAVVRVEMPRAALASFGLPVEAMEGSGTVRADLIVSADGTPQAIRLLSENDATAAQR